MEKKDLVIIGSGPAGLSAAVYAQRAMLKQVVIEKESYSGGQIVVTDKVDNYLGFPGEGGYELSVRFREHADKLKVPFLEGEVDGPKNAVDVDSYKISENNRMLNSIVIDMGNKVDNAIDDVLTNVTLGDLVHSYSEQLNCSYSI